MPAVLWAQDPLTYSSALERALAHHPGLQALEARVEGAQARVPQAGSLPDPSLGVTVFGESVQTRTGPQEIIYSIRQEFPWFGELDQRVRGAEAGSDAVRHALEAARLQVRRDLADVFYELGYVDHALELTGENLRLLQKLEPVVRAKVEGGGELNALLRLKVETGRLGDKLATLGKQKHVLQARLRAMLDLAPGAPMISFVMEPPKSTSDESAPYNLSDQNPELARLRAEQAAALSLEEVAKLSGYPRFAIGANYIQTGDPEVNPGTPDAGRDPWNVMATIRIPLWRGRVQAERNQARAEVRESERAWAWKRNELRAQLEAATANRADALRRLKLYGEDLLGLAEQAVENSRTAYEAGRAGLLEVIDSERSRLDLQLLYWRAAADAHTQTIIIETLTSESDMRVTTKGTEGTKAGEGM
jgi:outer membrane protein TolC